LKKLIPPVLLALTLTIAAVSVCLNPGQSPRTPDQPLIERTAVVSCVIDGDTIKLEGGEKVRLVGINAPELHSSDPVERMRAERAREFVDNFCPPGSEVGLNVDDLEPRDRYGRTLALVYVRVDGLWMNLNAELLRRGLAEVLFLPPSEFNPYQWLDFS
jgi:endonuclease YncB( thermonuclease family)